MDVRDRIYFLEWRQKVLAQAGRCKYTTILWPGKSKMFSLRVTFHTSIDIGQKNPYLPYFSLNLCAIFLGCPKTMTENRNHLPGWTLALLETAQSMQRQEGGGLEEPDLFSNYV